MNRTISRTREAAVAGLLASLLSGCGLLPGSGDEPTDWAGLADQIVAAAGSDQVVSASISAGGSLLLDVRVDGGDTRWQAREGEDAVVLEQLEEVASQPVAVSQIDWATMESAMLPDCLSGLVEVDWLPYGHVYQQAYCQTGMPYQSATIDGNPIPVTIEGTDAAAFQSAMDAMEPLFPDGQVLEFTAGLSPAYSWRMIGSPVEMADGSPGYYLLEFPNGGTGLRAYAIAEINFMSTNFGSAVNGGAPTLTFRPSDSSAAAYASALEEGLGQVTWSRDTAIGFAVAAISDSELGYTVWRLADSDVGQGTIPR